MASQIASQILLKFPDRFSGFSVKLKTFSSKPPGNFYLRILLSSKFFENFSEIVTKFCWNQYRLREQVFKKILKKLYEKPHNNFEELFSTKIFDV